MCRNIEQEKKSSHYLSADKVLKTKKLKGKCFSTRQWKIYIFNTDYRFLC